MTTKDLNNSNLPVDSGEGPDAEGVKLQKFPYMLREAILSPAELAFYKVLLSIFPPDAVILAKPRLADIFQVDRHAIPYASEARLFFKAIAQKHVDFLLCHIEAMKPLLGIELNQASEDQPDLVAREELVDKIFEVTNLPLVRFRAQEEYDHKELIRVLNPLWKSHLPPNCPKCDQPMLVRSVKKGPEKGRQFYVCPDYLNCKTYFPMSS